MIHANRIVTVGEQESIINRPIILYRGDREVEIEFTLVGNEFTFSEEGNVIKSVNASHGQLVLNTPSGEHMFSELAGCHEGKVIFIVTKEMIDEFIEVGFYSFQIRLYDSAEMKSRVTIPPVLSGFDIRNPIAAEDETNVVDQGIVNYARIFKDQSNEELPTFDWEGNYNKTEWVHHDVITENKMNKIEDALYSINANVKESDVVMLNALDNVKKDADKYVKEHMAEVEADVDEFERNLNTGVEKFKVDTNAAMTAHKNEVSEVVDGFSGEIESINSQLAHNTNYLNNVFSFDNYGAIGDGVTDDTEAIKRCIADASLISYSMIKSTPGKTYAISDTIIVDTNMNIDLQGDMVYTGTNDRPAFVIGSKSKTLTYINVNLSIYKKSYGDYSDFSLKGECDNMNIGVRLINIGQSKIRIRKSNKFTVGVQCIAIDRGFYFNDIELNTHSNLAEVEVTSLDGGWINGNNFRKIIIGKGSGMNKSIDLYGLLIHSRDDSYTFNSNWFNDITSEGYGDARNEGYKSILVYLGKCTTQRINFARVENSAKEYFAYFESGALDNVINKPPSFMTSSTSVYYENSINELRNSVVESERPLESNCKYLIHDSGDLREDVFVASNGKYTSKTYYHVGYTSYEKRDIPATNKDPLANPNYIEYHSYNKPFLVLDSTDVKTYFIEMNSGVKDSTEGASYKFYLFFFDEDDNIINITTENFNDYVNSMGHSFRVINDWFIQSNTNMYGHKTIGINVTDDVKSIGVAFNMINNIKVYCKDATVGKVRQDFLKKDRLYIGNNGYKIDDSTGSIVFTKI